MRPFFFSAVVFFKLLLHSLTALILSIHVISHLSHPDLSQMAEMRKQLVAQEEHAKETEGSTAKFGLALPEEVLDSFSEEQQNQLDLLRKEALKLALVDAEVDEDEAPQFPARTS